MMLPVFDERRVYTSELIALPWTILCLLLNVACSKRTLRLTFLAESMLYQAWSSPLKSARPPWAKVRCGSFVMDGVDVEGVPQWVQVCTRSKWQKLAGFTPPAPKSIETPAQSL